jgi:AcrR family transcriptional regulator
MTPRAQRKEDQRAEILQAAASLIAERGFHGMSMRDLADATGFGVSSLYNYFASKEELLAELQIRAFETLIAAADDSAQAPADPSTRLYVFISNQVRYFIDHADVMRVLIHEAAALPAEHRQRVRSLKEAYFRIGRGHVAAVFAKGCVGQDNARGPVDAIALDRATYSIFGMINWVWAWYEPAQHGTPDDVARSIHSLAVCGLVAHCPASPNADQLPPGMGQRPVSLLVNHASLLMNRQTGTD